MFLKHDVIKLVTDGKELIHAHPACQRTVSDGDRFVVQLSPLRATSRMYIYIRQKLSMQAVIKKERTADIATDIRDSNLLISIFTQRPWIYYKFESGNEHLAL